MDDMIDLSTATILNSPDVRAWPATTRITRLELRPSGVHIEFTKQRGADRWPDVPFGDPSQHGNLQYTLWIFLAAANAWLAAGCIEFWFGLDENGGPVTEYAKNWYYDPNRWPGMAGHQPAVGELVGFMVTSGDARHGDDGVGLHERSNVVVVNFPDAAGATYDFNVAQPAPPPDPDPVPVPTHVPPPDPPRPPSPEPPAPMDPNLVRLFELFEAFVGDVEEMTRAAIAIETQVEALARDGIKIRL